MKKQSFSKVWCLMIAVLAIAVFSLFDRTGHSVSAARVDNMPILDTILPDSLIIRNITSKPKPLKEEFIIIDVLPFPYSYEPNFGSSAKQTVVPTSGSISDLDW